MPQIRTLVLWSLLVCCLLACSCTPPARPSDAADASVRPVVYHGEPLLRTELFFGLSVQLPDGSDSEISEQQWQDFVDHEVTPRFPDGLTVLDSQGQWLHEGRVVKEKGKVLYLLHPMPVPGQKDAAEQIIETIREIYKKRFHQDSVLRTTVPAGVSF